MPYRHRRSPYRRPRLHCWARYGLQRCPCRTAPDCRRRRCRAADTPRRHRAPPCRCRSRPCHSPDRRPSPMRRRVLPFVLRVVLRPALPEDIFGDREPVCLLGPSPVIGGGRPPEVVKRDRELPDRSFDDGIGAVLDGELRLERGRDAPGEKVLLGLGRQGRERREPLGRRQGQPIERKRLFAPRAAGRPKSGRDRSVKIGRVSTARRSSGRERQPRSKRSRLSA